MAEDFPSDKYDFKAAPSARGFAERLIHAAAANYYIRLHEILAAYRRGRTIPPCDWYLPFLSL